MLDAETMRVMILRPALYTGILPRFTPREAAQRVLDDITKDPHKIRKGIEACLDRLGQTEDTYWVAVRILGAVYGVNGYGPWERDISLLKNVLTPLKIGLDESREEYFPAEMKFLEYITQLMREFHGNELGYLLYHLGNQPLVELTSSMELVPSIK